MSRGIRTILPALVAAVVGLATLSAPAYADPGVDVPDEATIVIKGDGSGHGRGMSQYGAYSAARKGRAYRAIVGTYYPRTRWGRSSGMLEVLVSADGDDDLVVKPVAGLAVRAVGGGTWAADEPGATRWRIRPADGGNVVEYLDGTWRSWRTVDGEVEFTAGSRTLKLVIPTGATVAYRGALRSSNDDVGDRVTVNRVPLEHYVKGVVPSEMPSGWPQQALRAQAVAARSYAAWRRTVRPLDVAYDLCDTAECQVYGGASAEARAATTAVRRTSKQVLTYRRKPIFAEFSASNGGYTVKGDQPYLPARPDPYEGQSKDYYGWRVQVTAQDLETFYRLANLTRIRVAERDRSRRVSDLRLTTEGGEKPGTYSVDVARFVRNLGLPSSLFEITRVR